MEYRGGNQLYPEINYGSTTSQQPQSYHQPAQPQQSNMFNQPIVQQPQMQNNPLMVTGFEGHREWTTDLFDCCAEPNTFLLTCMCYPCSICYLGSRIGETMCMPLFVPASDITLRNKIRTVGGIKGSMCNDCATVLFCGQCAACQEHRELTNMGVS
ncbi:cornifelin homolog [Mytilus trossulus]|uniref:cornifelin homolog n=1 Tax=Mytilus trossulus TaxID=6551 RepID=UPI0030049C9D